MVRGIEQFREWFHGYEEQYTIIGGTACDLLMNSEGLGFRATKDIDLVLIIEAIDADFGRHFWEFVAAAEYQHRKASTGELQFYRFSAPKLKDYPAMIELFSRKPDVVVLPENAALSPLPMDEEASSLSAILLNDDYYEYLKNGRVKIAGVTILDAVHLIPFKAKAWLDLSERRAGGEQVDSKNIRKHKNDIFRLTELLDRNQEPLSNLPATIKADMKEFLERMIPEETDPRQLGIKNRNKDEILQELSRIYG